MSPVHVTVVGSLNLDDAVRVAALPSPGETVTARSLETALGGKGANQAVAAARAGASVRMVGAVGHRDGGPLLDALRHEGVDVDGVVLVAEHGSGRAIVLVGDDGENAIVVVPGANHAIPDDVVRAACADLGPGDVLVLQHEVPAATSRLAARHARRAGATVLWNAAPAPASPDELVEDVDLLVVNEHELVAISGLLGTRGGDVQQQLGEIADRTGADVVCTLGDRGAAYRLDGREGRLPARRVEPVDTTAAGDTFVGYLAALADVPVEDRLRAALAAGSLAVTRSGAAASVPARAEVDRLLTEAPVDPGST